MSERARFCPLCGKAAPARERSSRVAVGEVAPPVKKAEASGAARPDGITRATRMGQTATSRPAPPTNSRRYAPETHALVGGLEQAGFGLRYGAWMFDFLITLIAIMVFTFIVTAVRKTSVVESNSDLVIVAALVFLLFVLNFVVLAGIGGQSAGMRILGIRIVRIDGKPFTLKDAALRHMVGYPLSMGAFSLGFLWMLWDPLQQAWHDKLARTMVVMSR
jgi:uncharacterized RDD family membrane protein YckC